MERSLPQKLLNEFRHNFVIPETELSPVPTQRDVSVTLGGINGTTRLYKVHDKQNVLFSITCS